MTVLPQIRVTVAFDPQANAGNGAHGFEASDGTIIRWGTSPAAAIETLLTQRAVYAREGETDVS